MRHESKHSNTAQNKLLLRLERLSAELAHEQARSDELLFSMLPPNAVEDLREGRRVRGQEYEAVTILFSDIIGFTDISRQVLHLCWRENLHSLILSCLLRALCLLQCVAVCCSVL